MIKPETILRFYKATDENIEAIDKPYLYLFSAKQWKDASEMQFQVDTSDLVALKQFVTNEVERVLRLDKQSDEYKMYFGYRYALLERHGRTIVFTSADEKNHLVELSIKEISSEPLKGTKKGLVRNSFFSKTGISCFTANPDAIEDRLHWGAFAGAGEGFCVEYDWPLLEQYFAESKVWIRGDFVNYYKKDKPKIILRSGYSQAVMENYCEIIFSLGQLMQDEKEFRLAKVYPEDIPDKDDRRKQPIPVSAITSIILGPNITADNRDKLISIVTLKFPGVKLMQIDASGGTYSKIPFSI